MVKIYKRLGYSGIFVTFAFQHFFDLQKNQTENLQKTTEKNLDVVENQIEIEVNPDEDNNVRPKDGLFGVDGLIKKYGFMIDRRLEKYESFRNIINIAKRHDIQIALRVNIDTNNQEELKRMLSKLHDYDILISATSTDKDCLVVASRDARIDILSFITTAQIESAFKGAISQCYHNKKTVEIGFEPLITEKHTNRPKLMRYYSKFFKLLNFPRNTLIVGSNCKDTFGARGPTEIGAIIRTLFKISEQHTKQFFRENQEDLLRIYLLRVSKQMGEMAVLIHQGNPDTNEYKDGTFENVEEDK
jgi:RNase P/RNase MRP subunit p30